LLNLTARGTAAESDGAEPASETGSVADLTERLNPAIQHAREVALQTDG
jgi:hypothetical protein